MINTKINMYSIDDIIECYTKHKHDDAADAVLAFVSDLTGMSMDRIVNMASMELNTAIHYLYRDSDNYKKFQKVIVKGLIQQADIDSIMDALEDGEYFIPEQIGLPCERFADVTSADHCYCEMDGFEKTSDAPTLNLTVKEIVRIFKETKGRWDAAKYAVGM